jgi:hypothetical protein
MDGVKPAGSADRNDVNGGISEHFIKRFVKRNAAVRFPGRFKPVVKEIAHRDKLRVPRIIRRVAMRTPDPEAEHGIAYFF